MSSRASSEPLTQPASTMTYLAKLRALVADDAWAMSFQTLGQYRNALLKAINEYAREQEATTTTRGDADTVLAHVKLQAAMWKQEALTQVGIVKEVCEVTGVPDWGPVAQTVRELKGKQTPLAFAGVDLASGIDQGSTVYIMALTPATLEEVKRDAEVGRQWRENSSLARCFPLTAEELDRLRATAPAVPGTPELVDRLRYAIGDPEGKLTPSQLTYRAYELSQKAEKWDEWNEAQVRVENEMPSGWAFMIQCSPDDWDTYLTNPEGDRIDFNRDCETLAAQMNSAVDGARAARFEVHHAAPEGKNG